MTKDQLINYLVNKNVPPQMYNLNGIGKGECYCIVSDSNAWSVTYVERGKSSILKSNLTKEEAYDFIYEEFYKMYG